MANQYDILKSRGMAVPKPAEGDTSGITAAVAARFKDEFGAPTPKDDSVEFVDLQTSAAQAASDWSGLVSGGTDSEVDKGVIDALSDSSGRPDRVEYSTSDQLEYYDPSGASEGGGYGLDWLGNQPEREDVYSGTSEDQQNSYSRYLEGTGSGIIGLIETDADVGITFEDPRGEDGVSIVPYDDTPPGQGSIDRSGESIIDCDDRRIQDEDIFVGQGAPPSLFDQSSSLPEEFIFDQRGATSPIEEPFSTGEIAIYNRNLIIPQQYYYNDYLSDSFFFRNPSEQSDTRYNFGSNVDTLKDDFRYSCGATWDHTSVEFGEPMTVYNSAERLDFHKLRVPNLQSRDEALENRGVLFHEIGSIGIFFEGLEDTDDAGFYMSGLELRTSDALLRKIFSNRQNRQVRQDEIAGMFYDFVFESTSQTLTDPRPFSEIPDRLNPVITVPNTGTFGETTTSRTYYSKNFYDHTFLAPAGYSRSYLDFYPAAASFDLVEITSHFPPGDMTIQDPDRDYPLQERGKKSFYRVLYDNYAFSDLPAGTGLPSGDDPSACPLDKIQKFPPREVVFANQMVDYLHSNSSLFDEEAEDQSRFVRLFYENFDSYNSITFNMSHRKQISKWLGETKLTPMFFEMIDQVYPSNSTFYSQVLDGWLNDSPLYTSQADEDENFSIDSDLAAVNLRPNEIRNPFRELKKMLNGDAFLNRPEGYAGDVDLFTYPLGFMESGLLGPSFSSEPARQYLDDRLSELMHTEQDYFENGDEESLYSAINHFREFDSNYQRYAIQVFNGEPSYSEVIAYRIEKVDTATGEVIQNFFFANAESVERFTFLDTQVIPGKRYTYKIFTINFVVGVRYNYEMNRMSYESIDLLGRSEWKGLGPDTTTRELFGTQLSKLKSASMRLPISMQPDLRLIEAPYYEKEITTVSSNLPPMFPDVSVAESHRTNQNNLEPTIFILSPQFGSSLEIPIALKQEDDRTIQIMKENQESSYPLLPGNRIRTSPDQIIFRSDSAPTHYEMFYSFNRPRSYQDLYGARSNRTSANQPFFDLDVPLNTELFVTFRAIDDGGFSNPGPIYEFIKHNYGDGTYFSFEKLELHPPESNISFEGLISIEPSIFQDSIRLNPDQTTSFFTYNFWRRLGSPTNQNLIELAAMRSDQRNFIPFSTVPPSIEMINLGPLNSDEAVWNRKFKFRITSIDSGNSFDLNTSFKYDRLLLESEDTQRMVNQCYRMEDEALESRRRENANNSNRNLNRTGPDFYNETTVTEVTTVDLSGAVTRATSATEAYDQAQGAYDQGGNTGQGQGFDRDMDRAAQGIAGYRQAQNQQGTDGAMDAMNALRKGETVGTEVSGIIIRMSGTGYN